MMALLSIRALLFLVFLWVIGLGQPTDANELIVSKMSIVQSTKKHSRQYFNIFLQPKNVLAENTFDDFFENRGINITILDKNRNETLDEASALFNDGFVKIINYAGLYLGLTMWTKSANGPNIHVVGYFNKIADRTFFLVDEFNESKYVKQLINQRIILDDTVNINMFMKTVEGKKVDEVNNGTMVTVFCKVRSIKDVKPKFENHRFPHQKIDIGPTEKEIRLTFLAEKGSHLKTVWCVADQTRKPFTIKVLHAPTAVRIRPVIIDTVMAGGHLKCSAVDGYPQPNVTWKAASVPPNEGRFYRIIQTKNESTFILNEKATVGSVWRMTCVAENDFGTFTRTVNFTVEMNQTSLLAIRLSALEKTVQQFQVANQTNQLSSRLSKVEETLQQFQDENFQNDSVPLQSNLEKRLVKQITNLKEELETSLKDIAKMKEDIRALTMKTKNDSLKPQLDKRKNVTVEGDNTNAGAKPDWFVWTIKEITDKWIENANEFSPSFFSDGKTGYKMSLNYYQSFSDSMCLTFNLMRSDDDDRLQWPMNRTVLIEIIDEQRAVPVISKQVSRASASERINSDYIKRAYDKPNRQGKYNPGDGFVECLPYDQIKSTAGAIFNDAMTVRCRVLPQ